MTTQAFTANATVALSAPLDTLCALRKRFTDYATITGSDDDCSVVLSYGTAHAKLAPGAIEIRLEAPDTTSLAYLQMGFADHLLDISGSDKPRIVWQGADLAGQPLPYLREMRVVQAWNVTPRMRRVRLAGTDLQRFGHGGLHVRLLLPSDKDARPVWPVMGEDGRAVWPEGERPVARVYTLRHIDVAAGVVDIDFVMHPGGDMPGANWAASAEPGEVIGMSGPGGGTLPDAERYIFAGDETGLPAIARMLEELRDGCRAVAFIEIADDTERQDLAVPAGATVHWLSRDGRPAGTTGLLSEAVRGEAIACDDNLFIWAGCEFADFKAIRRHLRKDVGLSRDKHLVAAYWRRGAAGDDARDET